MCQRSYAVGVVAMLMVVILKHPARSLCTVASTQLALASNR